MCRADFFWQAALALPNQGGRASPAGDAKWSQVGGILILQPADVEKLQSVQMPPILEFLASAAPDMAQALKDAEGGGGGWSLAGICGDQRLESVGTRICDGGESVRPAPRIRPCRICPRENLPRQVLERYLRRRRIESPSGILR